MGSTGYGFKTGKCATCKTRQLKLRKAYYRGKLKWVCKACLRKDMNVIPRHYQNVVLGEYYL